MTPSFFSFGRKRRDAALREDERKGAGASVGSEQTASRRRFAADLGALAAAPSKPEPAPEPAPPAPVRPAPAPPLSEADVERRERIDRALSTWRSQLVDLGGVASLDDITLLDGVVDLTAAHPSGLAQLYAGRPTHLSSIVRERNALGEARQSLREVSARTDILARQFGVAPVYLAIGVATWNETVPQDGEDDGSIHLADGASPEAADLTAQIPHVERIAAEHAARNALAAAGLTVPEAPSGPRVRTVNAPVLLRPVRLASATADATLTLDPTIEVNPVLTRALRRYQCTTDIGDIARAALSSAGFTPRSALARIGALGRQYLPGFEIHERLVVGAFVHPGQALVEDFDAVLERSRTSALVAAIAGDEGAREALSVELPPAVPTDRVPGAERGVGDLEPSQLDVIEAVGTGASFLIDAPPGSDVAGALAAVFADAAASGRTVLHVPATSADGHAVAAALREEGLGSMVLDLTEDAAWRQHASEGIRESLGVQPPQLDVAGIIASRDRLTSVRSRLDRYVRALHRPREPWSVSAYEALQKLAELTSRRDRATTRARIDAEHLGRLDEDGREQALTLLRRGHTLGLFTPEVSSSAWNGIPVEDMDEATDALVHLRALANDLLPTIQEHTAVVARTTGLSRARNLGQWIEQLDMFDGVRESLDVFLPEVFERSAADMVIATASKRWRDERGIHMDGSRRRRFTRQANDLVRPGRVVDDLHAELVKVQRRREVWRRHDPDGGWPRLPQGLDEMRRTAGRARGAVAEVQPLLGRAQDSPVLMEMPLEDLLELARSLAADDLTAQKLPEVNRIRTELETLGLNDFVADMAARGVETDQLEPELTYCWWSSLLAQILTADPDLGGLDARALSQMAVSLRELDAAHTRSLSGPVAQACARRVRAAVEQDKADARALYIALAREDGVPLREIIDAHPMALLARPIWIVPPTLVPQIFSPTAVVDLAVLDASTPMPVPQVLPAFVRAEQVLVVGDSRRATTGLAAELGPLLPSRTLPTARNSLDAGIAAFLAANGYEGVVEAVPSPPGEAYLSLELVDGKGMPAPGQTAVETVEAEVSRVVDMVIDRALTRPEESLAVIALNRLHADALRSAITRAAAGAPALEEFFAPGAAEPFTVVELAEARALRRDHIIISVGYAKTPHGRTIHNFGPVSDHSGMVGLVEALCSSRGSTQVVSCLAADDIDRDRLRAPGARLLREVLARAEDASQTGNSAGKVPDRLLVDLAEHLWRKGLSVVPRYGTDGGVRIPLAIGHPDYPDELLVAVLTDDVDYISEPSLRRRDRHRVERLERRGWHVHMAFSAGVFVDPEAEAKAIEELVLAVLVERQGNAAPPMEAVPDRVDDSARAVPETPEPESGEAHERTERPRIAQGLPLQAYSDDQLDDLMAWIRSDGVGRSEAREVEELRAALALRRRGSGIDAVLANAVRRTR